MNSQEIQTTTSYHVTITLKPSLYQYQPSVQMDKTKELILDIFKKLSFVNLIIVAELTKSFNIHYHCMASFSPERYKDKVIPYYVANAFRKQKNIGFIKCDVIVNENNYKQYMLKDITKFLYITGIHPRIVDTYQIFPNDYDFALQYIEYKNKVNPVRPASPSAASAEIPSLKDLL